MNRILAMSVLSVGLVLTLAGQSRGCGEDLIDIRARGKLIVVAHAATKNRSACVEAMIRGEGKDIYLDYSTNREAQKLLQSLAVPPDAVEDAPERLVEVHGTLHFFSSHPSDNPKGTLRNLRPDQYPLIFVKSLKVIDRAK